MVFFMFIFDMVYFSIRISCRYCF